ncbi:hypothetical protein Y032_0517g2814 [Ancylostoma ceylanicum]|uniref:CCDC92/74 N-terminal domain-containing protein n=1 Tax=Ancylostoma ceylanicum TaxID=53326 RepID=A0A016WT70_9BILA|nr:hypothetical protein Y032_0517g2814 [Ancylostoma ceylanicum]
MIPVTTLVTTWKEGSDAACIVEIIQDRCLNTTGLSIVLMRVNTFTSLYESDLELRLRDAIRQRDEQWRKHEREQITFLQNETAAMLRGLHKEIERLGHQLKGWCFS